MLVAARFSRRPVLLINTIRFENANEARVATVFYFIQKRKGINNDKIPLKEFRVRGLVMQREGVRNPLRPWYSTGTSLQIFVCKCLCYRLNVWIWGDEKRTVFICFLGSIKCVDFMPTYLQCAMEKSEPT